MTETKKIILLPGTQLALDYEQLFLLPEDNDIEPGETVELYSGNERLGIAEVSTVEKARYAYLQQHHFDKLASAHSLLVNWHDAVQPLQDIVPGFSITDIVTVVGATVKLLFEPGITVRAADEVPASEPEELPSEEEMYANLATIAEGE